MKLSNRQIGSVGVAKVTTALLQSGYSVLAPLEDCNGYDLVAEKNGKFKRIQVKCSTKKDPKRFRYEFVTSKGKSRKHQYTESSCDYIVCIGLADDLYWVFRTGECLAKNKKCHIRSGSDWTVLSKI